MRYPIAVVIKSVESQNHENVVDAVKAICDMRSRFIAPSSRSNWQMFWKKHAIYIESLPDLLLAEDNSQQSAHDSVQLQMWINQNDHLPYEYTFLSQFAHTGESPKHHDALLVEQWELVLSNEGIPRVEMILWNTSYASCEGGYAKWCHQHVEFCKSLLIQDMAESVWNHFAGPGLQGLHKGADEYWSDKTFMLKAMRHGILMTDVPDKRRKQKLRSRTLPDAGLNMEIGESNGGRMLIAVTDSLEALVAFEQQNSDGLNK